MVGYGGDDVWGWEGGGVGVGWEVDEEKVVVRLEVWDDEGLFEMGGCEVMEEDESWCGWIGRLGVEREVENCVLGWGLELVGCVCCWYGVCVLLVEILVLVVGF